MVLQPYNARQRRMRTASNVENRKPSAAAPVRATKPKRATRVPGPHVPGSHRALHDTKRRVSAASKMLSAALERARPPLGAPAEFVPMSVDAHTVPSPFSAAGLTLPRHLAHPVTKYPSAAALKAQGIDAHVNILYTRAVLRNVGPAMWRVLTSMSICAAPRARGLPRAVDLTVRDLSGEMPTHCLAIWPLDRQQAPQNAGRPLPVTMYPVHGPVLAANAAHLPVLPPGAPAAPQTAAARMAVPVVSLAVPAPHAFNGLLRYMYTKDHHALFHSFFPGLPTPAPGSSREVVVQFARQLAEMVKPEQLLAVAGGVLGTWRNACFLGVFDDALWACMDIAWEIVLVALKMSGVPTPVAQPSAA